MEREPSNPDQIADIFCQSCFTDWAVIMGHPCLRVLELMGFLFKWEETPAFKGPEDRMVPPQNPAPKVGFVEQSRFTRSFGPLKALLCLLDFP